MFNKLTSRARAACNHAGSEAISLRASVIGAEHILLGLLVSSEEPPFEAPLDQIRTAAKTLPAPQESGPTLSYSQEAMDVLRGAAKLATDGIVDVSHLWRSLLDNSSGSAVAVLEKAHVDLYAARQSVNEMLRSVPLRDSENKPSALDGILVDLSERALQGQINPVAGREIEINQVMTALARWSKNAPVLVGEPGVGKTAIVEGLAGRMAQGDVPRPLQGCKILSLNIGALVAGTKYRGDLEGRVQEVFKTLELQPGAILFIDELHTIMGAGSSEGTTDIAGLVKPLLARGDLRIIGATTPAEYSNKLERDPAFERRLSRIEVKEPSHSEASQMLLALKPYMEEHHKVRIDESAIQASVDLSAKYITTRFLPDKAVDVIDQAAAVAALAGKRKVGTSQVAQVLSAWTGIPAEELQEPEDSRLVGLSRRIEQKLIGQPEAVQSVSLSLIRQRAGLGDPQKPLGKFLFCGPTGVGKTELARILAQEVFADRRSLVRFDMSEYGEKHDSSRLIGSPPGYTGHQEGGRLVNAVRERPSCVLLFDEIEKAHPDVVQLLLQVMEEGELHDGRGRIASFRNTIIILTSNLGARWSRHSRPTIGFSGIDAKQGRAEKVQQDLASFFAPELLGRLDEIVVFHPLEEKEMIAIAEIQVKNLKQKLSGQGVQLVWNKAVIRFIADQARTMDAGARGIALSLRKNMEDPLAQIVINQQPSKVKVGLQDQCLGFDVD